MMHEITNVSEENYPDINTYNVSHTQIKCSKLIHICQYPDLWLCLNQQIVLSALSVSFLMAGVSACAPCPGGSFSGSKGSWPESVISLQL
jgi:hypothetical protein